MISVVHDDLTLFKKASKDFPLTTCVVGFGMLLKELKHKGNLSFAQLENLAYKAVAPENKDEVEFYQLIKTAKALNTLNTLDQPL